MNGLYALGSMRFANVSEFKGKKLVNIREYFTGKDGKPAPGKKGISLSIEQFKELVKVIPQLEGEI